jgi:hypothetical protein
VLTVWSCEKAVGKQEMFQFKVSCFCRGDNTESGRRKANIQELGHYCGGHNLDENDVVEADAVERVEQCKITLYLMHFDHPLKYVSDGDMLTLVRKVSVTAIMAPRLSDGWPPVRICQEWGAGQPMATYIPQ